jgi:hypothetical protein
MLRALLPLQEAGLVRHLKPRELTQQLRAYHG